MRRIVLTFIALIAAQAVFAWDWQMQFTGNGCPGRDHGFGSIQQPASAEMSITWLEGGLPYTHWTNATPWTHTWTLDKSQITGGQQQSTDCGAWCRFPDECSVAHAGSDWQVGTFIFSGHMYNGDAFSITNTMKVPDGKCAVERWFHGYDYNVPGSDAQTFESYYAYDGPIFPLPGTSLHSGPTLWPPPDVKPPALSNVTYLINDDQNRMFRGYTTPADPHGSWTLKTNFTTDASGVYVVDMPVGTNNEYYFKFVGTNQ